MLTKARLLVPVIVLLVIGTSMPVAAQPSTADNNSFGTVDTPVRVVAHGGAVPVEASVVLRPDAGYRNATFVVFAFNVHSDSLRVEFREFLLPNGTPASVLRDERHTNPKQPRFVVAGSDLPSGGFEARMRGLADPKNNGQFHLGAFAMGFDASWGTMKTPKGEPMSVYGYTTVAASDIENGILEPPFEGAGNVPAAPITLVLLVVAWAAFVTRRRPA